MIVPTRSSSEKFCILEKIVMTKILSMICHWLPRDFDDQIKSDMYVLAGFESKSDPTCNNSKIVVFIVYLYHWK